MYRDRDIDVDIDIDTSPQDFDNSKHEFDNSLHYCVAPRYMIFDILSSGFDKNNQK